MVVDVYVVGTSSMTPKATPSKPLTEAVDENIAVVASALPGAFITSYDACFAFKNNAGSLIAVPNK